MIADLKGFGMLVLSLAPQVAQPSSQAPAVDTSPPSQTITATYGLTSPPGLKVSHMVVRLPISLDSAPSKPYTAVVLVYEPTSDLPWRTTFSSANVTATLSDGSVVSAEYFAYGRGWVVSSSGPPTTRRVRPSMQLVMSADGKDVPVNPVQANPLTSSVIDAELHESGKFAWFLFDVDDPAPREFTLAGVLLRRKPPKK